MELTCGRVDSLSCRDKLSRVPFPPLLRFMDFLLWMGLYWGLCVPSLLRFSLFFFKKSVFPAQLCSRGHSSHNSETELQSFRAAENFSHGRVVPPSQPGCTSVFSAFALAAWPSVPGLSAGLPCPGTSGGFGFHFTSSTFRVPGWAAKGPWEIPSKSLSTLAPAWLSGFKVLRPTLS